MASTLGDPPLLTDSDADMLASQFLDSGYADTTVYCDWSLDRRIEGFLRRRGLVRLAEDGDAYGLILDRVMAHIGQATGVSAAAPPTNGPSAGDFRPYRRPGPTGRMNIVTTTISRSRRQP
ncbi:hypothetical protein [Mycobacterium shinjukuense]|uniref:Uncharacterized protein n=1 Tax=Mycobacterium shinjukuense TaxID=398694 RepID=A0A7I7MLN2_9MYCO|nr:hypothetical protein MSHI_09720 [Mycobacterium shinjukuense]